MNRYDFDFGLAPVRSDAVRRSVLATPPRTRFEPKTPSRAHYERVPIRKTHPVTKKESVPPQLLNTPFLLCFIQYELKAYVSKVSYEKQDTVKRYIGRYDSAPKYYLSTNLETLFAHLIEKQDRDFLGKYLFSGMAQWKTLHESIQKWFPKEAGQNVWRDFICLKK